MDISPNAMVGMALNMQSSNTSQQVGALVLRKSLNMAANEVATLLQSATPQLATSGTLGTQVNTYA